MGLYIKQNGAIKPLAGSTPGEGLPVGAITAFTANSIPSGWLLCDGSTFDETLYPALFLALGGNVLPDLRNRFLEGANSVVREYKEAGLPNIEGELVALNAGTGNFSNTTFVNGAFSGKTKWNTIDGDGALDSYGEVTFDASLSNEIYGNSDTVQPASYTVNYIIKATSGITTEAALDAFNMIKEYERKQNLLSDIETLNVTANTNYTAEYDGYLMINLTRSSDGTSKRTILVNGIPFIQGTTVLNGQQLGEVSTIILKKGDVWSIDYTSETNIYGRWYKLRDYEGRV